MDARIYKYSYIPFYLLMLLITSVPFAISMYFENPVDLVKSSAFEITGALFIILTLVISIELFLKNDENFF